jgi:hypothetical protein
MPRKPKALQYESWETVAVVQECQRYEAVYTMLRGKDAQAIRRLIETDHLGPPELYRRLARHEPVGRWYNVRWEIVARELSFSQAEQEAEQG